MKRRRSLNQKGFSAIEILLVALVLLVLLVIGLRLQARNRKAAQAAHVHTTNTAATNTSSKAGASTGAKSTGSPAVSTDPYAGWGTYTNNGMSFKYPSNWMPGPGHNGLDLAAVTSPAFTNSAIATPQQSGAPVTLTFEFTNGQSGFSCSDVPCHVIAMVPLKNPQLPNAYLALVNQVAVDGTTTTQLMGASSYTHVGDITVDPEVFKGNIYLSGAYYYSTGGGSSVGAEITNPSTVESSANFKDLINLLNSASPTR